MADPLLLKLQYSWKIVEANLDLNAVRFMLRLLEDNPELLDRFSFRNADPLEEAPSLKNHGKYVLKNVGEVVGGIVNLSTKETFLKGLGGRHINKYKVQSDFFSLVEDALLWTIETAMGPYWDEDCEGAWCLALGAVTKLMAAEAAAGGAPPAAAPPAKAPAAAPGKGLLGARR